MLNFALIGAAGYVAPKHMKAIRDTGNNLVAVFDPNDDLEILDSYFLNCEYFNEIRAFGSFISQCKNTPSQVDIVVVCSPNYLHHLHVRFALEMGCDVICESPLVLSREHLEDLVKAEQLTGRRVHPFLQLKQHPAATKLYAENEAASPSEAFDIQLMNITSRGKWYQKSWKGDPEKSGGLTTIFGFHYFELLISLFGDITSHKLTEHSNERSRGSLVLQRAKVDWYFSINQEDLPEKSVQNGEKRFQQLMVNNQIIDLNNRPELFHSTYQHILQNKSVKLHELKPLVEFLENI
jgi:UDP-N-acetyl-2-amino-2-deoxyglucuronate dehydrogenase